LLGVISMFVAIFILLALPFVDTSNIKGNTYKPIHILAFWIFALNFLVLMWLGSCHVEPPFIIAGQLATGYYFIHFLIIIPLLGIVGNVLSIIGTSLNVNIEPKLDLQKNGKMKMIILSRFSWDYLVEENTEIAELMYNNNFIDMEYATPDISKEWLINIIIYFSILGSVYAIYTKLSKDLKYEIKDIRNFLYYTFISTIVILFVTSIIVLVLNINGVSISNIVFSNFFNFSEPEIIIKKVLGLIILLLLLNICYRKSGWKSWEIYFKIILFVLSFILTGIFLSDPLSEYVEIKCEEYSKTILTYISFMFSYNYLIIGDPNLTSRIKEFKEKVFALFMNNEGQNSEGGNNSGGRKISERWIVNRRRKHGGYYWFEDDHERYTEPWSVAHMSDAGRVRCKEIFDRIDYLKNEKETNIDGIRGSQRDLVMSRADLARFNNDPEMVHNILGDINRSEGFLKKYFNENKKINDDIAQLIVEYSKTYTPKYK